MELVKTDNQAATKSAEYVKNLMTGLKDEFLQANAGMGLDFVYIGSWLVCNKKGQFKDRDNDALVFGDNVDIVIGGGEERFMLWGKDGTPESGTLLIGEDTQLAAETAFDNMIETKPELLERYTKADIQGRYIAYVVPVQMLGKASTVPTIYMLSMSPTSKFAFGKYGMEIFKGAYAKIGIPAKTPVSAVVTRISTEEKTNSNKQTYVCFTFAPVELFNLETLS